MRLRTGVSKWIIAIVSIILVSSCKKYLDAKSDTKLVIPSTLADAQALLDAWGTINAGYYPVSIVADDDYYLPDSYYRGLATGSQYEYTWNVNARPTDQLWIYLYKIALQANVALETVEKVKPTMLNINEWKRVKGSALFIRAYAYYFVAQFYAEPYDKNEAARKLGIPLRLNSDSNEPSVRSSLEETWQQIVSDFKQASELLPNGPAAIVSRPCKAAAFAALARTYLAMQEYNLVGVYADSSLKENNKLLDYNLFTATSSIPFPVFNNNSEVLFHTYALGTGMRSVSNARIDSNLYRSYAANDLRKALFFQAISTTEFGFKGDYHDGASSSIAFNGIATDEVFLMRAESSARLGNKDSAMADLTRLLSKRFKNTTPYVPPIISSANQALDTILLERRKELLCRGTRWFDLRRLNKEPRFAKTLIRNNVGQQFTLPPNDPRYTFYIPDAVIALTGMQQNVR